MSGEAAQVVAEIRQFGVTIPVRKFADQFYVPLVDQSSLNREVLVLDHLKRDNWPDYAGALSQMLRPLINDKGAGNLSVPYGHWVYQHMFTTPKGSDGGGHAAYAPEDVVRWSSITEEKRAAQERAAILAYQSCRIIDGVPYRECTEPRYIARMQWSHVQIDIQFDDVKHGKALGPNKDERYEPPMNVATFRLDRYDDMIDYVRSRIPESHQFIMWGNLDVDLNDITALRYDDEANDLIRTAQWVVENDYESLLSASDEAILAWANLKRTIGTLKGSDDPDMGDTLSNILDDYLPFALSAESKRAIADATSRFSMRPMDPTRKF